MFSFKDNVLFGMFFVTVLGDITNTIIPCHKNDAECMRTSGQSALPKFATGLPELGLPQSDPLPMETVEGDLSGLKFSFTESTAKGIKNCKIKDVLLDIDGNKFALDVSCTDLAVSGKYVLSGRLMIIPVEGVGNFEINSKRYEFSIKGDLKQIKGKDGEDHFSVKKYTFKAAAHDGVVFKFANLFNGNKELSDAIHTFANENWKEVTEFVQEPVLSSILKSVVKNLNKYFKLIPINELFIN